MGIKKLLAAVLTAALMMTFIPASSMAATTGWQGSDSSGWRYYTTSTQYVKNSWKQISGNWYYFDSLGHMESNCYRDGCWLTKSGVWDKTSSHGIWKSNYFGWWYEDNGWFPKSRWLWIDGERYYFDKNGYVENNCYRDGCWLTSSGAWDKTSCHGTWKRDSNGWWYEDDGWYPKNRSLKIDGSYYWFNSSGYWKTTTSEPTGDMVWIPKTGSKYHSRSNCSNMKNPSQVTLSFAKEHGYGKCSKCW